MLEAASDAYTKKPRQMVDGRSQSMFPRPPTQLNVDLCPFSTKCQPHLPIARLSASYVCINYTAVTSFSMSVKRVHLMYGK